MSQMNLSARAYHRILKLARTISDLAGSDQIQTPHVAEALQYRPKGCKACCDGTIVFHKTAMKFKYPKRFF